MSRVRYCFSVKLFVVLFSLLLFVGCQWSYGIFIENTTSDNFHPGGPNGGHVNPGESVSWTTLTDEDSSESVELWRSYGCIARLCITTNGSIDTYDSITVTIYDTPALVKPAFTFAANSSRLGGSIEESS